VNFGRNPVDGFEISPLCGRSPLALHGSGVLDQSHGIADLEHDSYCVFAVSTVSRTLRNLLVSVLACLAIASAGAFANTVTFTTTASSGSYTVPIGVTQITIVARGADGGVATASAAFNGGQGATVTAIVDVSPGDVVQFVVGAAGGAGDLESGGGGGTGVFVNGVFAIVAGGGGGEDNTGNGGGGQAGTSGSSSGSFAGAAGTGGNGGGGGGDIALQDGGAGGGGILSAGADVNAFGPSLTTGGGQADTNLGDGLSVSAGGTSTQTTDPAGADGLGSSGGSGFGGGGAASHRESGAGGGYSGGGGGGSGGNPGGGGSFLDATIAGYVSGSIAAGITGGGAAANGFVSIAYVDPTIVVSKVSNNGVGTFTFTGDNGFAGTSITTVTPGVAVAGLTQVLTAPGVATTLTEGALHADFILSDINCTGLGSGGTATATLATQSVTLDAAATVSGAAIVCSFTNTKLVPSLTVVKTADLIGPAVVGDVINYTIKVTNTGNTAVSTVTIADSFNGYGTPPVPQNEILSLDVAPLGDSSDGAGNDGVWDVLAPGDEVTFTATYTVVQQDVDFLH
jgi:uncharacterized repeat protein (TIGR01451 family)